jgi:prephenate decarboxylase
MVFTAPASERQEESFFISAKSGNCQQLVTQFWQHKAKHLSEYLNQYSNYSLSTLGPSGTSSEATAKYLLNQLVGNHSSQCILYPSFEESTQSLLDGRSNLLLVANAYQRIDQIYMHPQITPLFAVLHPTPNYGIAKRRCDVNLKRKVKIATHHAPSSLMQYLIRDWDLNYKMILVDSTSQAAINVQQGRADLCMTNTTSAEKYDLEFISPTRPIYMLWSLFGRLREGETHMY